MDRLRRFCGTHATHAAWSVSTLAAVVTILSLLGLLPWATRAELLDHKTAEREVFGRIEGRLDAIYRALGSLRRSESFNEDGRGP